MKRNMRKFGLALSALTLVALLFSVLAVVPVTPALAGGPTTFTFPGGSLTTTNTDSWGGTNTHSYGVHFNVDAGPVTIEYLGVNAYPINYTGDFGWPPDPTDTGASVGVGLGNASGDFVQYSFKSNMGGGVGANCTLHPTIGGKGSWDNQTQCYWNDDGYRSYLFQGQYTGNMVATVGNSQYNAEKHGGPTGTNPDYDTFDFKFYVEKVAANTYEVTGWHNLWKSSAIDEGCYWDWNSAKNAHDPTKRGYIQCFEGTWTVDGGLDLSDVNIYLSIENWQGVQPELHTFDWDSVVVTGTVVPPSEVWVDDAWTGYSDGDPADGHTFGYDAFDKIQDGIDAVSGSTVNVAAGTYTETVSITKAVTLTGESESGVIVQANASGPVDGQNTFTINAAGKTVTIEYMTIRHGDYGIRSSAGNVNVLHCTIYHNGWDGTPYPTGGALTPASAGTHYATYATDGGAVRIENSASSEVAYNTVYENDRGLRYQYGSNGNFHHNSSYNNIQSGIYLTDHGAPGGCTNTQVHDNTVYGNMNNGILALRGNSNTITDNNVYDNWNTGIHMHGPSDFTVEGNTVTNNSLYAFNGEGNAGNSDGGIAAAGAETIAATSYTLKILDNTVSSNNAGSHANSTGIWLGTGLPSDGITVTGNTFTSHDLDIHTLSQATTTVVNNNKFDGTGDGIQNDDAATLDATNNWWGDASGPGPVGPGSGDNVSTNVDYSPWWGDATGTFTVEENAAGELEVGTDADADDVQALIDAVSTGTTIVLPSKELNPVGGFTIDTPGITIKLSDGTIIQGSSPCFTVTADNTTITSDFLGGKCIPTGGDHGIVVSSTVTNTVINDLVIRGIEIDGSTTSTGDGIHITSTTTISNLQIFDNYIHHLNGDGIEYASGVTIAGVHEVQGNLFQNNGGYGVNNETGSSFNVTYNSWSDISGPTVGAANGVSGTLTYDPWTHVVVSSTTSSGSPVANKVGEGYQITYTVKMDAKEVYGADFDLNFDETKLEVITITNGGLFPHECDLSTPAEANISGTISFRGGRASALTGSAQGVYTVTFQGEDSGVVTLDLDEADDAFRMLPGYGSSTNIYASALTDGSVTVYDATTVTGRVDLQGRPDDTGAVMTFTIGSDVGYGPFVFSTSTYWGSISASNVVYTDSYTITVGMARYLDVTATITSTNSVTITTDNQVLTTLALLGGDANDDDEIDISDIAIIGGVYGKASGDSGWDARADINADDVIDISDLVLTCGNYDKKSVDAYASWTP